MRQARLKQKGGWGEREREREEKNPRGEGATAGMGEVGPCELPFYLWMALTDIVRTAAQRQRGGTDRVLIG